MADPDFKESVCRQETVKSSDLRLCSTWQALTKTLPKKYHPHKTAQRVTNVLLYPAKGTL